MRFGMTWAAAAVCALGACSESREVIGFTGAQSACASCHTAPDEGPPFRRTNGLTEDPPSGGAHDRHIAGAGVTVPINCSECHVVPQSVGDPGHIDGAASISFGPLARTGGLSPTSCGATHCHGGFPGGNAANAPAWFAAREEACGTCHSLPPPTGQHERHVGEGIACTACHGDLLRTTHVNGIVNIGLETYSRPNRAFPGTCTQVCHHDGVAWFDE